jgi:hypothetical protein
MHRLSWRLTAKPPSAKITILKDSLQKKNPPPVKETGFGNEDG